MNTLFGDQIANKVRKINIFTKRLMNSSISGDYLSAFKSSGLEFDQIREYQYGDDVRFIDWNSSAKSGKIMLKQYISERDRTIILMIDVSLSTFYSSCAEIKKDMIAQVAATLAFVANNNKDRVGVIFFSDQIECFIPPKRSNLHIGRIIEKIFALEPKGSKTNIDVALNFLVGLKKRNAIVFMLSDFIDIESDYSKILRVVRCEYDFIAIKFLDKCEKNFYNLGLLEVQDIETNNSFLLDTRNNLDLLLKTRLIEQKRMFEKQKIDMLELTVGRPFINVFINFFKQRIRRQI